MESEVLINCQWKHCEKAASTHVVFGSRVFDPSGDIHISDISAKPEHLDLCAKHIELISLQYVHVSLYELGGCPMHPQNLKASPKSPDS